MTHPSLDIAGPSDGTVAVDETRLAGLETDYVEVHLQHSDIMWDSGVAQLVVSFLLTQKFRRD